MIKSARTFVRFARFSLVAGSLLILAGCSSENTVVVTLTRSNFEDVVLKSKKPVLIDFWAEWCIPCKEMAPMIHELAAEYQGKAVFGKVNVDDYPDIAKKHEIAVLPTFLVFKDGQIKKREEGMLPRHALVNILGAMQ